jgi:hypothetical protein
VDEPASQGGLKRKFSDDEEELKIWRCNEKVTLLDADGDAFAHGVVIDGEPSPTIWNNSNSKVATNYADDPAGYWVVMKLTSVVNNAIDLPADSCFAHDGHDLAKSQLKPKALMELEEGFLVWHDYLRPRMLAPKTVKKSKNASTRDMVKGSSKKKCRR